MSSLSRFSVLALAGAALLSSCAVYTPTLPSTPLVTQAGQVEFVTALHASSTLEASVAYSPVSHLMVLGDVAYDCGSNTHAKAGFGLGGYQLVGKDKDMYLGATGGMGFATVEIIGDPGSYFSAKNPHITTDYTNYYGQLYAAHLGRLVSFGAAVRATGVSYHMTVDDNARAVPTRVFLEPNFFIRFGRGPVQLQGSFGSSQPLAQSGSTADVDLSLEEQLAPRSRMFGIGVVIRPHLFTKH